MSQVPERREKQKKKKAAPKCKHCKQPLKGHKNVVDCPRNRKEKINCYYSFINRGSLLIYKDDSFSGIFMSYNVQVSINLSEYDTMP